MSTTKTLTRSTKTPSSSSIERRWYIIDAQNKILGRLSTKAAGLLIGKGKSNYVANLDLGDHVIIINAKKIVVTGSKEGKKYYHHSGYPGGLKETDLATLRKTYPDRIITSAIRGMLP